MSPLTDAQIKQIAARQIRDTSWEPNEVYMNREDSLAMQGETAHQALAELDRLRAENTWLRNQMGDVRGMQSDGATAEEMDAALGRALSIDDIKLAPEEGS